ncbi:hypothetical protein [Streptomyces sp. NBC_00687]|uniref:hypothetical protein n=1 Tax=Streptomyces sp. NBC_00687 TaxID=2975807 RepID=UPI00224D9D75|nr:hypothetical protein [Streptomyces sp. NBC_00687]MCX4919914.1 hypothetical protein [Streptomyces sp. NBC_00687]
MPTSTAAFFTRRITAVTDQLTAANIPLTATAPPPLAAPTDPWASTHTATIDRSTLAWCTAAQMLADHHQTSVVRQVASADALLRELGVRGLAQLHSDLNRGAPVDYAYTRCPYCDCLGEDPTLPTCADARCPSWQRSNGHGHTCPVCHGADYQPEALGESRLQALDNLLAATADDAHHPARRTARFLRRRSSTTGPPVPDALLNAANTIAAGEVSDALDRHVG